MRGGRRGWRPVIASLQDWHDYANCQTALLEQNRVRQFGLKTAIDTVMPDPQRLPGEIWAWQSLEPDAQPWAARAATVRVGFAGHRLHLGHLGLARTAAQLTAPDGEILVFDASAAPGQLRRGFLAALEFFAEQEPNVHIVEDGPRIRRVERQAVAGLRIEKLRRLYGWDERTTAAALADLQTMLGFFLYTPTHDQVRPSVALVDAMQAPHSAVLSKAARAAAAPAPALLYRRLFPSLRRHGLRASVRDASSVVFADDASDTVRSKFARAVTGGRPSVEEQHERGGDPARCTAFAMIELLCPPEAAQNALSKCLSGVTTCAECKSNHADAIVDRLSASTTPRLRAGQSTAVIEAIATAAAQLHRTPPRDAGELERAIAEHHGVGRSKVVVGHGSTEIMDWAFRSCVRPGGGLVATEPTFELYRHLGDAHGLRHTPARWNRETFGHDASALAEAIDTDTAVCILDIPQAVSGAAASAALIGQVADLLPDDALLILDMVCANFMDDPPSFARLLAAHPRALICGSLSKAQCLLGARVGYALADDGMAAQLRRQRLPYAMDSLALAAASAAIADDTARLTTIAASREARVLLTAELDRHDLTYIRTQANFLLMDLGPRFEHVANGLRRRGHRFRDGQRWGMPGWMQVHLIDAPLAEEVIRVLRAAVVPDNEASPDSFRPSTPDRKAAPLP